MQRKFSLRSILFVTVLLIGSSFWYLPYYVSKPGMARELKPIIEVQDGFNEEGTFMLTTVRMGRANIYTYALASFSKYQEIYPLDLIRDEDETDEEYTIRQLHAMEGSKLSAIEVAYKKAEKPVDFRYKGVYVLEVFSNMPAEGKLQPGDRITMVDGQIFQSKEDFIKYIGEQSVGKTVEITYFRGGVENSTEIGLQPFDENQGKVGIGITLVDDKEIIVSPKVEVNTEEIGGPSAGLMFSLEIYNQLTKEDLTKGYKIAGTGTISSDGTVGRIGGIEQKIIAADKAGAEIFLAPNENGASDSNYNAAVITAADIGSAMEIVPINTFDEAIHYLENLE